MGLPDGAGTQPARSHHQENSPSEGGIVYANQGGTQTIYNGSHPKGVRGVRADTKLLLVLVMADLAFFFYGMVSYTGRNTSADTWHAVIFVVMLGLTISMLRSWLRRRLR